jgi:multidrug resistance efflux pump
LQAPQYHQIATTFINLIMFFFVLVIIFIVIFVAGSIIQMANSFPSTRKASVAIFVFSIARFFVVFIGI